MPAYKSILIIDDNDQDRKIIQRFLTKAGYQILDTAASGEEGIHKALALKPDVILLDTMMPGLNGFETCAQLKQKHKIPSIVIIMTGQIDSVDAQKAKAVGADDYCAKTSDCSLLLEALGKWRQAAGLEPGTAAGKDHDTLQETIDAHKMPDAEWGAQKTADLVKELYKELEKKNEELRALDKLKSEFVSTVSHELRTPLTIIKGAISQITEGLYGDVNEEQKEKLEMALRSSELLQRIINDLLDIAKLEARKIELKKKKININDIAQEVISACLELVKSKGLSIKFNTDKDIVEVLVDRDRMTQVLTNLIGNAVKFTEQGVIEVGVHDTGDHVLVSVKDTGCGISQEDLPKVFDKFQQFGKSFAAGQEGTGLGLSICEGIIKLHGGKIWVETETNKGSKFIFTLPR